MRNYPTLREVPGEMESAHRQNQGSGERTLLSNATLDRLPTTVSIPGYDRGKISAGIVHFGVGNFHRAHEALYVDRCLHLGGQEGWGIVGVGLGEGIEKRAKARAIKAQDGLYTLTEYAPDGSVETRVVGALLDYLYAPSEAEAVLNRLAHPAFVVDEPHLTDHDRTLLRSSDPLAVLKLSPFEALELPSSEAFKVAFLETRRRLAKDGPIAALAFAANARGLR